MTIMNLGVQQSYNSSSGDMVEMALLVERIKRRSAGNERASVVVAMVVRRHQTQRPAASSSSS